ncbi:MAG: hypothetical protein KF856_03990 [Cyclobacteriaceae bacterium]|nr:hypothetical protein [Cyclobacteriaceae bacterium]
MRLVLIILITTYTVSSSMGQIDSTMFRKYKSETIYFKGNKFIKKDQLYPLRNLKNEFKLSNEGEQLYKDYKSDQRVFLISYSIGVGALLTAIAIKNPTTSSVLGGVGTTGIGVSIPFLVRGQNLLQKAIWIRNRDVLVTR